MFNRLIKFSKNSSFFLFGARGTGKTFLLKEITIEQVVRRLDPFRRFLVVAAQMSGQIINFSKIAREVGVSAPAVRTPNIISPSDA